LFIKQDLFIRSFLQKELNSVFVSDILIKRKANLVNIFVYVSKNSFILKNNFVSTLNENLSFILFSKFSLSLSSFNIVEIADLDSSSSFVAYSIKQQLEKRVPFRKVIKSAVSKIQSSKSNVKGIKVQISGRLNGAEIARSEWIREGRIPLNTLRSSIDYSNLEARLIF
jgi:small subunit ribosomal protein S3